MVLCGAEWHFKIFFFALVYVPHSSAHLPMQFFFTKGLKFSLIEKGQKQITSISSYTLQQGSVEMLGDLQFFKLLGESSELNFAGFTHH